MEEMERSKEPEADGSQTRHYDEKRRPGARRHTKRLGARGGADGVGRRKWGGNLRLEIGDLNWADVKNQKWSGRVAAPMEKNAGREPDGTVGAGAIKDLVGDPSEMHEAVETGCNLHL